MNLLPAVFLLLPFADLPPTKTAAPNLIVNPSLVGHVAETGLPPDWDSFPIGFPHHSCQVMSPGRTDDFGVSLDCQSDWSRIVTNRVLIEAGSRQAGQVWLKRTGGEGGVLFFINYYDAEAKAFGKPQQIEFNTASLPLGQWTRLSVEQSPEPGAVSCSLVLSVSKAACVLLDDFDLRLFVEPRDKNLLFNGNAETARGQLPLRWEAWKFMPQEVLLQWSDREPHSGWGCCEVQGRAERVFTLIGRTDIDATKSYRLEGWQRFRRGSGQFRLVLLDDKLTEFRSYDLSKEEDVAWKRSEKLLSPADLIGATQVLVGFECKGEFDASIDDVVFTEVVK